MVVIDDPFVPMAAEAPVESFAALALRQRESRAAVAPAAAPGHPLIGRLQGFDLLEQPLISDVAVCPGEVLTGRTTVPLRRAMIGRQVVLLFDGGDVRAPIVMGVIESQPVDGRRQPEQAARPIAVESDGERHVIDAEREIVLRCGDASITLTRAGKVIIKGNYILSRSTGYNKIKGAAVDIN